MSILELMCLDKGRVPKTLPLLYLFTFFHCCVIILKIDIHYSKLLLALGVKRVVFGNYYDRVDMSSLERFNSHNIEYEYLPLV